MIRTFCLATSLDGFIATIDNETPWSETDAKFFRDTCNEAGNIIVGRKTYEAMTQSGDFKGITPNLTVIISKNRAYKPKSSNHIVVDSPEDALVTVQRNNFQRALIIGGGEIYKHCLTQGLVDEILLDIEPLCLGIGISWGAPLPAGTKLELLSASPYAPSGIQLRYTVKR